MSFSYPRFPLSYSVMRERGECTSQSMAFFNDEKLCKYTQYFIYSYTVVHYGKNSQPMKINALFPNVHISLQNTSNIEEIITRKLLLEDGQLIWYIQGRKQERRILKQPQMPLQSNGVYENNLVALPNLYFLLTYTVGFGGKRGVRGVQKWGVWKMRSVENA